MAVHQQALQIKGGRSAWGPRTTATSRSSQTHCSRPCARHFAPSAPWGCRRTTSPTRSRMHRFEPGVIATSGAGNSCPGSSPSRTTRRDALAGAGFRCRCSGGEARPRTHTNDLATTSTMRWWHSHAGSVRQSRSDMGATSRWLMSAASWESASPRPNNSSLERAHRCGGVCRQSKES